jgi:hypothetical protein
MPAGDLVFQRLESATDAEMRAMAIALREEKNFLKEHTRPEKVDFLSRWLRADAGSAPRNLFRSDHELPYFKVLEDVVEKAVDAAKWKSPKLEESLSAERIENYIVRAFSFAVTGTPAPAAAERARKEAEEELFATVDRPSQESSPSLGKLLAGAGAGALVGVIGVGIGLGALWLVGPAPRRTIPAVLVLIHIAHRIRVEATLRSAQ